MPQTCNHEQAGSEALLPPKHDGETFTQWWCRLTPSNVVALHAATTWLGIEPRQFFDNYLRARGIAS